MEFITTRWKKKTNKRTHTHTRRIDYYLLQYIRNRKKNRTFLRGIYIILNARNTDMFYIWKTSVVGTTLYSLFFFFFFFERGLGTSVVKLEREEIYYSGAIYWLRHFNVQSPPKPTTTSTVKNDKGGNTILCSYVFFF